MKNNPNDVKNPIIPIILLFAAIALGVVGYQVFRLMLAQDVAEQASGEPKKTGNVFQDMALNHPKNEAKRRSRQQLRQSYNALPFPHNIQMGNELAKIRLTIFTDIACAACRQDVNKVLKDVPFKDVHIVFKHAPQDEDNIKSGLFEQMAKRNGILESFQTALYNQGSDSTDIFMMQTLEKLGVTYKQQQEMLKDEPGSISRDIDKDLAQADKAGIATLPTFFLNRYRMGEHTLPIEKIAQYIDDLKNSRPIFAEGHN